MQKYPIVALIGTSGSGKTSLLLEMLKLFPDLCAPIKSKVTRPRRNAQDDIFYDFVTPEEFARLETEGRLFQQVHYAGYRYGCDREQTDAVVAHKLGLIVLVESSVADFKQAGYQLHLVHIVPEGHHARNEAQRLRDDAERAKIALQYDATIVNSFGPGGFHRAVEALEKDIEKLKNRFDISQ